MTLKWIACVSLVSACGGTTNNNLEPDATPGVTPDAPLASAPNQYQYGMRYEPPVGKVAQGAGHMQAKVSLAAALTAAGSPDLPSIEATNMNIGPMIHGGVITQDKAFQTLVAIDQRGAIANIGISMKDFNVATVANPSPCNVPTGTNIACDIAVVDGMYDAQIDAIADGIAQFDKPVFIRIGFEFNNGVGYTEHYYVAAYRKIHDTFVAHGVTKAAYVWTWEPSGSDNYYGTATPPAHVPALPTELWYPGDSYVDWYGIDLFKKAYYFAPGGIFHAKIVKWLADADAHHMPVMLPEFSNGCFNQDPVTGYKITADGDPQMLWDAWFGGAYGAMDFVKQTPGVKLFNFVNEDMSGAGGTDCRVETNAGLLAMWIAELANPIYLSKGDVCAMKGMCSAWTANQTGATMSFAQRAPTGATTTLRTWDFGNGVIQTAAEPTLDYTYPAPGTYTVTLTTRDNAEGVNADSTTQTITVL